MRVDLSPCHYWPFMSVEQFKDCTRMKLEIVIVQVMSANIFILNMKYIDFTKFSKCYKLVGFCHFC
jgi:hypothetical protein